MAPSDSCKGACIPGVFAHQQRSLLSIGVNVNPEVTYHDFRLTWLLLPVQV